MGLGVSAQQLQAARATLHSLVASLESDAWQEAIKSATAKEN
jgi:hypothetical protein